jgi:NAD-dependent DNA ligase
MARTTNSLTMNKYIKKINSISTDELQEYFNTEPFEFLNLMKIYLDDIYYNSGNDTGLSDEQYDMLKDTLIARDPDYNPPIGAIVRETENRVKVPCHMGSMDKIRPDRKEDVIKLRKWIKQYNSSLLIQDKLDGVSCLIVVKNGEYKLYKRPGSDGYGADITYLLPYLKTIPKNLDDITVRGELIIQEDIYNKKYTEEYKNSRNMVSGLTSSKKIGKGIKDIDFVVYERVTENATETPLEMFKELKQLGFQVVNYEVVNEISMDDLSELLGKFKLQSQYKIDGIVVQSNSIYIRNTEGNPDYSFAFKMNIDSNMKESEVISVEWNISKWGLLKPRVQIQPVHIGGVVIQYATGFYGKFIRDNGIGPGAIVKITRSGDVIPFIVGVIRKTEPSMPTIPYKWNESGVDIYTDQEGEEISIKQTISFFSSLNIKFIGASIVRKLYQAGFNSVFKIIGASIEQMASIDGMGNKSAERIYSNIRSQLEVSSLSDILASSGVFGFGISSKRVDKLIVDIPNLLELPKTMSSPDILSMVKAVEGFSTKTASNIVINLEKANTFMTELNRILPRETKVEAKEESKVEVRESRINNYKIVCTGFRDGDLEKEILLRGATIISTVSKNTDIVVVKNLNDKPTVKVSKAIQLGISIVQKDDFVKNYL